MKFFIVETEEGTYLDTETGLWNDKRMAELFMNRMRAIEAGAKCGYRFKIITYPQNGFFVLAKMKTGGLSGFAYLAYFLWRRNQPSIWVKSPLECTRFMQHSDMKKARKEAEEIPLINGDTNKTIPGDVVTLPVFVPKMGNMFISWTVTMNGDLIGFHQVYYAFFSPDFSVCMAEVSIEDGEWLIRTSHSKAAIDHLHFDDSLQRYVLDRRDLA